MGSLVGLGSLLYNAGRDVIQGFLNGAGSLLATLGTFFLNKLPGFIREPFKKALGIQSPSTVFAGFGKNVVQGLANGINGSSGLLASAMAGVSDQMQVSSTLDIGTRANGGAVLNTTTLTPATVSQSSIASQQQPTVINLHMDGIMARSRGDLREIAGELVETLNESLRARRLPEIGGGSL